MNNNKLLVAFFVAIVASFIFGYSIASNKKSTVTNIPVVQTVLVPHDVFVTQVVTPTYSQTEMVPLSVSQGLEVSRIMTAQDEQTLSDMLDEFLFSIETLRNQTVPQTLLSQAYVVDNFDQLEKKLSKIRDYMWMVTHNVPQETPTAPVPPVSLP